MTFPKRFVGQLVSGVVLALVCLLAPVTDAPAASAASSAVARGKVRGEIIQTKGSPAPKIKMQWFDANWKFLGARRVNGGVYSLSLPVGRYYLQFVDQRPAYDVTKSAPADVTVNIQAGRTVTRTVRMRRGAAIGGTVKAGGKVSPGATVVAANTNEQSYTSRANDKGQYAIGGLPGGNYSIFTYDRKKVWVGKSVYLPKLKGGQFKNVNPALTKRGGKLSVDLYAGDKPFKGSGSVTAVSRTTGQFWTARISRGTVLFQGLYPGGYYLDVPGSGNYLAARVGLRNKVRPGRVSFSSAIAEEARWLGDRPRRRRLRPVLRAQGRSGAAVRRRWRTARHGDLARRRQLLAGRTASHRHLHGHRRSR